MSGSTLIRVGEGVGVGVGGNFSLPPVGGVKFN